MAREREREREKEERNETRFFELIGRAAPTLVINGYFAIGAHRDFFFPPPLLFPRRSNARSSITRCVHANLNAVESGNSAEKRRERDKLVPKKKRDAL